MAETPAANATASGISATDDCIGRTSLRRILRSPCWTVDATDVAHRICVVHETTPHGGGHVLTPLYPQWETGSHAATTSAAALAELRIQAGDRVRAWRRDPVDVFAFHVGVPRGAASVEVDLQFLLSDPNHLPARGSNVPRRVICSG